MENLTAFSLFAIVASITPGPTNFLILSLNNHHKISRWCFKKYAETKQVEF